MTYSLKDGLKQGNNGFFGPKTTELGRRVWQERNVITFLGTSGTPQLNGLRIERGRSPIDAIRENFFGNVVEFYLYFLRVPKEGGKNVISL